MNEYLDTLRKFVDFYRRTSDLMKKLNNQTAANWYKEQELKLQKQIEEIAALVPPEPTPAT